MTDKPALDCWTKSTLRDVATIIMGQSPPGTNVITLNGSEPPRNGLPFLQGNAEFSSRFPIPQKWCLEPLKVAERCDTLISVRAPVGELNIADQRLAIGRGLAAIRFTAVEPTFGWHLIAYAKRGLEKLAQGSTFEAIGGEDLRKLPISVPPILEQRAIAAILDSIDEAIQRTEEVIAATEELRQALLQDLLTRGVPGWHTEWKQVPGIGTIPADWEVVRLGEVAEVITSGSRAWARFYSGDGALFVRSQNIRGEVINSADAVFVNPPQDAEAQRTRILSNDLLISITGEPGHAAVADQSIGEAYVSQHVALLEP